MIQNRPNYESWSDRELVHAYRNMNRVRHPDYFEIVKSELEKRKVDPTAWKDEMPPAKVERPEYPSRIRRYFAEFLDSIVIAVIALAFFPLSAFLGDMGDVIPMLLLVTILFGYYGFGDSGERNGQTLGKKWLNLKVVKADGRYLSLKEGFFRATFWALYTCSNMNPDGLFRIPVLNELAGLSSLIVFLSFFLILFHPQKRGVPDLLTDSVVIYADQEKPPGALVRFPQKLKYAAVIAFVVGGIGLYLAHRLTVPADKNLESVYQAVLSGTGHEVQSLQLITRNAQSSDPLREVEVIVFVPIRKFQDPAELAKLESELFPLVKKASASLSPDQIRILWESRKMIGLLPTRYHGQALKKWAEIPGN